MTLLFGGGMIFGTGRSGLGVMQRQGWRLGFFGIFADNL